MGRMGTGRSAPSPFAPCPFARRKTPGDPWQKREESGHTFLQGGRSSLHPPKLVKTYFFLFFSKGFSYSIALHLHLHLLSLIFLELSWSLTRKVSMTLSQFTNLPI